MNSTALVFRKANGAIMIGSEYGSGLNAVDRHYSDATQICLNSGGGSKRGYSEEPYKYVHFTYYPLELWLVVTRRMSLIKT